MLCRVLRQRRAAVAKRLAKRSYFSMLSDFCETAKFAKGLFSCCSLHDDDCVVHRVLDSKWLVQFMSDDKTKTVCVHDRMNFSDVGVSLAWDSERYAEL